MTAIWDFDTTHIESRIKHGAKRVLEEYGYQIQEIVVFGSYGRGEATDESDLDILIVVDYVGGTEKLTDTERQECFYETADYCRQELPPLLPPEFTDVDVLVGRWFERDKMLLDVTEHYDTSTTKDWDCLAYNLTEQEKISVIHP